jgi:GNAT superfamily N-acetyltransferase
MNAIMPDLMLGKPIPTAISATDDAGVLGFVSVKGAEIVKLYVSKRARGTGAAHALWDQTATVLAKLNGSRSVMSASVGRCGSSVRMWRR